MNALSHPHPCNFRLHRHQDRGWGELAFEYRWDSTSGCKAEDGLGNPDLEHCYLYEMTCYEGNMGRFEDGFYRPCEPPFLAWRFREPTDGRTGPVGYERFVATQGWAWDRHKLGGRLIVPDEAGIFTITAIQQYRFHCERCGADLPVPGSHAGPHALVRRFSLREGVRMEGNLPVWRYELSKHGLSAWMDINMQGYVADSAAIGFGPC